MKETDDAMIITMDLKTLRTREGGYKRILQDMANCDEFKGHHWWYHRLANTPLQRHFDRVTIIFWVIGGRIRFQSLPLILSKDEHGTTQECELVTYNFDPIPRLKQVEMKGFRGFRYANSADLIK